MFCSTNHPRNTQDDETVYIDYSVYARKVANVEPLPYEEWATKTRSTLASVAPNNER
jgi:hypothetical protein